MKCSQVKNYVVADFTIPLKSQDVSFAEGRKKRSKFESKARISGTTLPDITAQSVEKTENYI